MASEKQKHCSFCGKGQNEIKRLIAGPAVFICEECVALCTEICAEEDFKETFDERETMIDLTATNFNPEKDDAI